MYADRDSATLLDLVAAARAILGFCEGLDRETFLADFKTVCAVQHQIMVMGEAVKRLSPAFLSAHPDLPWNAIARMRDRLIHGYNDVDVEVVWNVAQESIPNLLREITPLLPSEES